MFRPYHTMTQCKHLENVVKTLRDQSALTSEVRDGYYAYHFALLHKLKCAHHHVTAMKDLLATAEPQEVLNQTSDFIFQINMRIDSYFYVCGSAMDILAREVLTYFGGTLPTRVYFQTAYQQLSRSRPNDLILQRLADPTWLSEFSTYRNTVTHELMIAGHFNIGVSMIGDTEDTQLVLPLPDDPRKPAAQRTFRNNPDVVNYCEKNFKRLLSLVNTVYNDIAERADAAGQLPIP